MLCETRGPETCWTHYRLQSLTAPWTWSKNTSRGSNSRRGLEPSLVHSISNNDTLKLKAHCYSYKIMIMNNLQIDKIILVIIIMY